MFSLLIFEEKDKCSPDLATSSLPSGPNSVAMTPHRVTSVIEFLSLIKEDDDVMGPKVTRRLRFQVIRRREVIKRNQEVIKNHREWSNVVTKGATGTSEKVK